MIVWLSKIPTILLLVLSAASVITGDYFGKLWSINQKGIFLGIAIAGYLLSGVFYLPSLLKEDLIITSIIWSLLSILGFLFVGLVLFKEHLTSLQTVGVIIGIIALIILSISQK